MSHANQLKCFHGGGKKKKKTEFQLQLMWRLTIPAVTCFHAFSHYNCGHSTDLLSNPRCREIPPFYTSTSVYYSASAALKRAGVAVRSNMNQNSSLI